MKKFISFHKIPQFRDVIHNVSHQASFAGLDENNEPIYKKNVENPILEFTGTVKLHGSNASVSTDGNEIWYQSRKKILTPESDNYDFCQFGMKRQSFFEELFSDLNVQQNQIISIFGEYCGQGIQSGVGISQLPKMFVIFAIKVVEGENSYYLHPQFSDLPENQIYNIYNFDTFKVSIDFNYPQIAQGKMTKLVEEVEKQCPVARDFGITTGNTTGEGIVWTGYYKDSLHIFKTKGEQHSISKSKDKIPIDADKMQSTKEFVEYAVTENRMNQAVSELFTSQGIEPTIKEMGSFLKWVMHDITKEEIGILLKNCLTVKDVSRSVSNKARSWFQELLDRNSGLKGG